MVTMGIFVIISGPHQFLVWKTLINILIDKKYMQYAFRDDKTLNCMICFSIVIYNVYILGICLLVCLTLGTMTGIEDMGVLIMLFCFYYHSLVSIIVQSLKNPFVVSPNKKVER